MSFLDEDGVRSLWAKIKAFFVAKVDGKGLSTNDYTTADKKKLAGITAGANAYSLPTASASTLGGVKVGTNLSISGGVLSAVDTTYGAATTSTPGLMSAADKGKLDGVATGANAYTHPGYTAKSAGLYKVKVDGTGHVSGVTAVTKADITGLGIPAQDTTYGAATRSAAGLMAALDKAKLDGVAYNANNYSHPWYSPESAAFVKVGRDQSGHVSGVTAVTKADITALGIPAQDTTYSLPAASASTLGGVKVGTNLSISGGVLSATDTTYGAATTSTPGLMSAADKGKLDGVAAGANAYTHPGYTAAGAALIKIGRDASGHVVTGAAVAKADITALGIPGQDTTYSAATTSTAGLMSATDKAKLDGVAAGANAYSLPTASASTLGGVKVGTNLSISGGVLNAVDTTYGVATTSNNGLMAATDKTLLNTLSASAVANVVRVTSGSFTISADDWTPYTAPSGEVQPVGDIYYGLSTKYVTIPGLLSTDIVLLQPTYYALYDLNRYYDVKAAEVGTDCILFFAEGTPSPAYSYTVLRIDGITNGFVQIGREAQSPATYSTAGYMSTDDKKRLGRMNAGYWKTLWSGEWGATGCADLTIEGFSSYDRVVFVTSTGGQTAVIDRTVDNNLQVFFSAIFAGGAPSYRTFRITQNGDVLTLSKARSVTINASTGAPTIANITDNLICAIYGIS